MRTRHLPAVVRPAMGILLSAALLAGCSDPKPRDLSSTPTLPPLTEKQEAQLEDVKDRTKAFDVGPLYALLENVSDAPAGAFSGLARLNEAKVRDIYQDPQKHRGEGVLIEGVFLRGGAMVPNKGIGSKLARQDFGETLNVWAVRLGRRPQDQLVYVCFPSKYNLPTMKVGDSVRMSARFYEVLQVDDATYDPKLRVDVPNGRTETYQMFIGASAEAAPDLGTPASPMQMLVLVFVAVLGAGGGLLWLRWFLANSAKSRAVKSPADRWAERLEREREESDEADAELGTVLPTDPGLALAKLEGVHDAGMQQPTGDEADLQPRGDDPFAGLDGQAKDEPPKPQA